MTESKEEACASTAPSFVFDPLPVSGGECRWTERDDCTIKIWNMRTGELHRTLYGHEDWVYSVALSEDGQSMASGS